MERRQCKLRNPPRSMGLDVAKGKKKAVHQPFRGLGRASIRAWRVRPPVDFSTFEHQ